MFEIKSRYDPCTCWTILSNCLMNLKNSGDSPGWVFIWIHSTLYHVRVDSTYTITSQSCLIRHIQNGGRNENLRMSLVAQRNPLVTWKVGWRENSAPVKFMHKKKPIIMLEIAGHLRAVWYEDRDTMAARRREFTLWWAPVGATKTNAPKREMPRHRRIRLSSTNWTSFGQLLSSVVVSPCCSMWTGWSYNHV